MIKHGIYLIFVLLFFLEGTSQGKKVMVLLQENGGSLIYLPDGMSQEVREASERFVDGFAEGFTENNFRFQGTGLYDTIISLTDFNCTLVQLVNTIISESIAGNEIDLYFIGHGLVDEIRLFNNERLTNDKIRGIRKEARARGLNKLNLRLVYSCACFFSSLQDDFRAIGAKVVVGAPCVNYMPEPHISMFLNKFIKENKTVFHSVSEANSESALAWAPLSDVLGLEQSDCNLAFGGRTSRINGSKLKVFGEYELKFRNGEAAITGLWGRDHEDLSDGIYFLKPLGSGKYLDVSGSCLRDNGCQVQLYSLGKSYHNNRFRIGRIGPSLLGGYTISCMANNKVVDADYFNTHSTGCRVQTWDRKSVMPRDNQEWYIESVGRGRYSIKCVKDGLVLGVKKSELNKKGSKVMLCKLSDSSFEHVWIISQNI